jgi:major membrane immunogen (membrane-anchored lipoprotein)
MDRRKFLQGMAAATAAMNALPALAEKAGGANGLSSSPGLGAAGWSDANAVEIDGHTLLCQFQDGDEVWKVYEDLRVRDGAITFVSAKGKARTLAKSAEATFPEADPPYLGLKLSEIGMAGPDLLADRLLADGDPDPAQVKAAAPPMASAPPEHPWDRPAWNTILGTVECSDTMPVFPAGNTRAYHPIQYFPELDREAAAKRHEGLIGGWMPAARKVFPAGGPAPGNGASAGYIEAVVFGDIAAEDKFIVQTWHRTARIQDGKIVKVQYGYSYPAYPPAREDPSAEEFYRGLLRFATYWDKHLSEITLVSLPDNSWIDMSRHAFAKELVVRPGGFYPKYGAVDRDYYGSEYDGFQDTFTMSLYANLEWGRFAMARRVLDNYYSDFVDAKGMVDMRGPETAQFGLTLSLLARYFQYTGDQALLAKHRAKIEATAALLTDMHDESLRLPQDNVGYGLIHGWNESDSCLMPKPATWWQPYFANSAFAARGLRDIAVYWKQQGNAGVADKWLRHSRELSEAVTASVRKNVRHEMTPPYIGPLPGATLTFRESLEKEHPSPQGWPHRAYAELLHADVLPPDLANMVIDCMRAYGATTLGVVANVESAHPDGRDILGFISYGYAQALLRLDRVEEYLLFLYAHRYHDHSRGSWTAGEVSGITGDTALFCIPAQQTIPLLVRWMLVMEDSDADRLYLGKGLPREWVVSGKEIRVEQAPTRWGRVGFRMIAAGNRVTATVELPKQGGPKQLEVKFRLPKKNTLKSVTVNGKAARVGGVHKDSAWIATGMESKFEVVAEFA